LEKFKKFYFLNKFKDSSSTPKNGSNGGSTLSSDERTVNQNINISLDVSDSDSTEMV